MKMLTVVLFVLVAETAHAALTKAERDKCLNLFCNCRRATGKRKCLKAHNMERDLHEDTNPLKYNITLEAAAQLYADHLMDLDNKLAPGHDPQNKANGWGENLFWMYNSYRQGICADAVYDWYTEEGNYNYVTGQGSGVIGHFTQIVWKGSTEVGVGIATSGDNTWVVAKYWPSGNSLNQYTNNVGYRKSGSLTPTLTELDYDICTNIHPVKNCEWFMKHPPYDCTHSGVKAVCYKHCTGC